MWYEKRENLAMLASWLLDDGEWKDCSGEVNGKIYKDNPIKRMIYFISKPWKWNDEWEKFLLEKNKDLNK